MAQHAGNPGDILAGGDMERGECMPHLLGRSVAYPGQGQVVSELFLHIRGRPGPEKVVHEDVAVLEPGPGFMAP